jgi:hypothetical protein
MPWSGATYTVMDKYLAILATSTKMPLIDGSFQARSILTRCWLLPRGDGGPAPDVSAHGQRADRSGGEDMSSYADESVGGNGRVQRRFLGKSLTDETRRCWRSWTMGHQLFVNNEDGMIYIARRVFGAAADVSEDTWISVDRARRCRCRPGTWFPVFRTCPR